MPYQVIENQGKPIKAWIEGVFVEEDAKVQLRNVAKMPFIFRHIAVMPDVHVGSGATIGSVIPTQGAVIPAAVGRDLHCGVTAIRTSLRAEDLPDNLSTVRSAIEEAVPHGKTFGTDKGAWNEIPDTVRLIWNMYLQESFVQLTKKYPKLTKANSINHLGTLGGGNHHLEISLDEEKNVWINLHSGSRGIGGAIGDLFISLAKGEMKRWFIDLTDNNLAYLPEGHPYFLDYMEAIQWTGTFAKLNRELMICHTLQALQPLIHKPINSLQEIDCHHNFLDIEHHFQTNVYITRKGAVRARKGEFVIIPASMATGTYIAKGLGNVDSFQSCSHGAGRRMSRTQARKQFTIADHVRDTAGVECKKDESVLDETPQSYKPIEDVMSAQQDLVEIVHKLQQIICIKG